MAHGLTKEIDGTIMIEGDERFLVKMVLTPRNIEFVRPNSLSISVIDTERARHFSGNVGISVHRMGATVKPARLARQNFPRGLFKTGVTFPASGQYQLTVHLDNDATGRDFVFLFSVEDERIVPLGVAGAAAVGFLILIGVIALAIRKRNSPGPQTASSRPAD